MNLRRVTDSKDNEVIKLIALYEDTFLNQKDIGIRKYFLT